MECTSLPTIAAAPWVVQEPLAFFPDDRGCIEKCRQLSWDSSFLCVGKRILSGTLAGLESMQDMGTLGANQSGMLLARMYIYLLGIRRSKAAKMEIDCVRNSARKAEIAGLGSGKYATCDGGRNGFLIYNKKAWTSGLLTHVCYGFCMTLSE